MRIYKGRPTVAEVDRTAIRRNFGELRKRVGPKVQILAIVKADAYGHGAPEVARILEKEGAMHLGVATVEEGAGLRDGGVTRPRIYVFAGFVRDQVEAILQHRLTPAISSLEMAECLNRRLRGYPDAYPVHIKVDTGLGRMGVLLRELPEFLEAMKKLDRLRIEAVCSHPGSAHDLSGESIETQMAGFVRAGELCAIHGSPVRIRHIANSVATIHRPDLHFEMVRPGLALYGLDPSGSQEVLLEPAMKFRTSALLVKRYPPGHGVGYDQTFVTERESVIATLPVGYADGYPRSLSNRGEVLVGGRRAPVVGKVSMDSTMVDVTDLPDVEQGDEVVLWGRQKGAEIRVDEVAERAGTISYELLTGVGQRVPRLYRN